MSWLTTAGSTIILSARGTGRLRNTSSLDGFSLFRLIFHTGLSDFLALPVIMALPRRKFKPPESGPRLAKAKKSRLITRISRLFAFR